MSTTGMLGVTVLPTSGVQNANAELIFGAGDCAIWLDPSDSTTVITGTSNDKIITLVDKVASRNFRYAAKDGSGAYISESALANLDTTSFLSTGVRLENAWFYSDGNAVEDGPVQFANVDGELTYFAVLRLDTNPSDASLVPILVLGGREAPLKKYASDAYSASITVVQEPRPGFPNSATIRIRTLDGVNDVLAYADIPATSSALIRASITNGALSATFRLYVNSTLIYENTNIPLGLFSVATMRSVGIAPDLGTGTSAIGEVIAFRGTITSTSTSEIEAYLTSKWIKPFIAVTLGDLANLVGTRSGAFTTTVDTVNAETVTARVMVTDLPQSWTATLVPGSQSGGNATWTIEGAMPATITDFYLEVTATNAAGDASATKRFKLVSTLDGSVPSEHTLYHAAGDLSVWLDMSEPINSTYNNDTGRVSVVRERQTSAKFLVNSSETPTRDVSTFSATSLAFAKTSEGTSGLSYSLALDLSTYPELNVVDPNDYTVDHAGAYATHPRSNGLVYSNTDGEYTVIMVGSYTAKAGGGTQGELYLGSDFPYDTSVEYYVQRFGLVTNALRSDPLEMLQQDAGSLSSGYPANEQMATDAIPVSGRAIAIWRKKAGLPPEMLLGINGLAEVFVRGSDASWSASGQKFSRLFGFHSVGSFAELLMYSSAVSDASLGALVSHLTNKWMAVAVPAPTFTNFTPDSDYAGTTYSGTVNVSNGTSDAITNVTIVGSAGQSWTITADQNDATLYHIAGVMPTLAQDLTLTLGADQSGQHGTGQFTLHAVDVPISPSVGDLAPLTGVIDTAYEGALTITNADEATVSAAAGSGWTIARLQPGGTAFKINGTLPSVVTIFNLTVVATRSVTAPDGTTLSLQSQRTFQITTAQPGVIKTTQFPLDLTGQLASNRVSEIQTLTPDNGARRQMLVPAFAPFYMHSMVVEYRDLVSGVWVVAEPYTDYQPFCEFSELSRASAYPLYGAITVNNTVFEGSIRLTYQTLGGNFVIDRKQVLERLALLVWNQREINWSQVVDLPDTFPVDSHTHSVDTDLIGLKTFKDAIDTAVVGVAANILPADVRAMVAHIADFDDPHQLSKGDVNLSNVPNYPVATDAEARDQNVTNRLLTPRGLGQAALQHIPVATDSVAGKVVLNQGTMPGDATDATKTLTAQGLYQLMIDGSGNAIQVAFASGDSEVPITPWPLAFPRYWKGLRYNDMEAFLFAVRTALDIETLVVDHARGVAYIPRGIAPIDLATYANAGSYALRDGTTEDWTDAPMRIPVA